MDKDTGKPIGRFVVRGTRLAANGQVLPAANALLDQAEGENQTLWIDDLEFGRVAE